MTMYLHSSTNIFLNFYSKCLLCTLSGNIINMQILIFVAEIGTSKSKNLIFHVIFLNKDISVTTLDIALQFSMIAPHIHSEGRVSKILHLGPTFCSM